MVACFHAIYYFVLNFINLCHALKFHTRNLKPSRFVAASDDFFLAVDSEGVAGRRDGAVQPAARRRRRNYR